MTDDKYFNRYSELTSIILDCYTDYYILQEMDNYNHTSRAENKVLPKCSIEVINYISFLAKRDLALKIYILTDPHKSANTIYSFGKYLRDTHGKSAGFTLSKASKHVIDNDLKNIRNHSLAHNDINKSNASITISTLKQTLDDVRAFFNSMCFPEIDDRVRPISDSQTYVIAYDTGLGLHLLIENSLRSTEKDNSRGNQDA